MVKNVNVAKAAQTRKDALQDAIAQIGSLSIHMSLGNSKMGKIPSFSVLPIITCKNCSECSKNCYACLGTFNFPGNIRNLADNTAMVTYRPMDVIAQINDYLNNGITLYRYFRFNVAGDVFNDDYLNIVIQVAKLNPMTTFLVFTKNFDLFNARHDDIPQNVSVVFSRWDNTEIENPHDFPVAIVKVNEGTQIPQNATGCDGDCAHCLKCWKIKKGESVYFDIH